MYNVCICTHMICTMYNVHIICIQIHICIQIVVNNILINSSNCIL